jgi:hypothetical protein
MKLDELQAEWKKDSQIDELNLGSAAIKTSELHAKYLNVLTTFTNVDAKTNQVEILPRRVVKVGVGSIRLGSILRTSAT